MLHAWAAAAALLLAGSSAPTPAQTPPEASVRAAIVHSIERRMGPDAAVIVESLEIFTRTGADQLEATPTPSARAGHVVEFALTSLNARPPVRIGYARARVRIAV